MIVYGDPSFTTPAREFAGLLWSRLAPGGDRPKTLDDLRSLLIHAGQLEQALADGLAPPLDANAAREALSRAEEATGHAAAAFRSTVDGPSHKAQVDGRLNAMAAALKPLTQLPDSCVTVKVPEGFAFYTLFPEQYVAAARRWLGDHAGAADRRAVVVGVRSIGTTLSAVVAATLVDGGWDVHRLTVRPTGHPYARRVDINPAGLRGAAHALVVDEGPGQSGSSMAAAAQALADAGIDPARVTFFPGHGGEPGGAASDAVRAWWAGTRRYAVTLADLRWAGRSLAESLADRTPALLGSSEPVERVEDLGGGLWRNVAYNDPARWPAACPAFERTKYRCVLQGGRAVVWKFAGLAAGPAGQVGNAEDALRRLDELARGGWTSAPRGTSHGFVAVRWIDATPMSRHGASPEVLTHVGRYASAARGPALSAADRQAALARLREMLYWNTWESLGEAVAARTRAWGNAAERLAAPHPVPSYGDGRLAPHEWLRTPDGRILKVDCVGHDVDHTVVGPQPVAWDVAGALMEWGLEDEAAAPLLSAFCGAGGPEIPDDLLTFYRMAYAAFRVGMCSMCAGMLAHDPDEQARLRSAEAFYREKLSRLLERLP